jgi:hypothetical protein
VEIRGKNVGNKHANTVLRDGAVHNVPALPRAFVINVIAEGATTYFWPVSGLFAFDSRLPKLKTQWLNVNRIRELPLRGQ